MVQDADNLGILEANPRLLDVRASRKLEDQQLLSRVLDSGDPPPQYVFVGAKE
jgi:hypothetical protein